jgi:hypothetical protein
MSQTQINKEFEVVKKVENRDEHYKYVVDATFDEEGLVKKAVLEIYYYPIYPYGNYVKDVIVVEEIDNKIVIERFTIRMNWDGTGREDVGKVVLDDIFTDDAPIFLRRDAYEEMEKPEDFENIIKDVIDLIKYYADIINPFG